MMRTAGSRRKGGIRSKPYGLIYLTLRERRATGPRAAEQAPPSELAGPAQYKRAELIRFGRRLGAIPKAWPTARAAEAMQEVILRMASESEDRPQQVYYALVSFCAEDDPSAVCAQIPRCAECPIADYCEHPERRLTIKDLPETERPRERLLQSGEEDLSDVELLAIIIGAGSQEATALELAGRLLSKFGSFRRLAACTVGELTQVHGIGPARAAQVKAALAIARRYASEKMPPGTAITGSDQLFRYMREKLYGLKKERFYALLLDTKHRIIREEEVAVGSLNESVVHPREAFKSAVRESAAKVIFVHNHPSGNPEPSPQDRRLTARLCEAGGLVGIQVLDHLIVGDDSYYSFAEHGLLGDQAGDAS